MLGYWTLEGDLAVWAKPGKEARRYTKESLDFSIGNLKAGKASYTDEAYGKMLSHFEAGRGLFPSALPTTNE